MNQTIAEAAPQARHGIPVSYGVGLQSRCTKAT